MPKGGALGLLEGDLKIKAKISLSGIFFIAALDARGILPPIVHVRSDKISHIYTAKQ